MKVIIAGGVAAGMSAASKLKRECPEADVVVYERGGETSYGACGLPYYVSGVNEDEELLRIRKKEAFLKAGIGLKLYHEVFRIDPGRRMAMVRDLETGETWEERYDFFVAATGASAIIPPVENVDLENIFTLKTIADANRIRAALKDDVKHVVIVGGGYIGMELAEAFLERKLHVRVIERMDGLLGNFDPEFGREVLEYLSEEGVCVHLNEEVVRFEGSSGHGPVTGVVTDRGTYDADLVILSVGVRPNTEFLRDTGIRRLPNGAIRTDQCMRSSLPRVYAGGDCASVRHLVLGKDVYLPLGTNANKQGRFIGENILGRNHGFYAVGTAMIKIGDLELGRTGVTEQEAAAHGLLHRSVTVTGKDHAPYYPGGEDIKIKLVYEPGTGVILGAQLIGRQGTALRTDIFAVAVTKAMTVRELGETDLGYAPPYAMPWDIVQVACNAAK